MVCRMKRELIHQLDRLSQERQRLEVLLSRLPSWLALKQLSELPEPSDDFSAYVHQRRKAELESELLHDPLFSAHCSVMSAIQIFEKLVAPHPTLESPPQHAATGHEVEASKLADLRASRVVNQAATIHVAPPRQGREEATLTDADAPPDRLTRIRRIDKDLAAALIARGIRHFAQIAAFGPADVRSLSAALGLGRRISQENWIEQAALLAMNAGARHSGADVNAPRSRPLTPDCAQSIAQNSQRQSAEGETSSLHVQATADGAPGRQRTVATVVSAIANAIGGHQVDPIAATIIAETSSREPQLQVPQTAERDDQAEVREMVRDAALRIATAIQASSNCELVSPAADHAPQPTPSTATSASWNEPTTLAAHDDLQLLSGVTEAIAIRLQSEGVTRFDEIAAWSAEAVAHFKTILGAETPISQLGWIEQSALLARGETTAYAARKGRGECAALVPRPPEITKRDEAFAAWLAAQSHSHAPPTVDCETVRQTGPHVVISAVPLTISVSAQPIDVEFEEVSNEELADHTEVVAIDALTSQGAGEPELLADNEHVNADVTDLHHVTDIHLVDEFKVYDFEPLQNATHGSNEFDSIDPHGAASEPEIFEPEIELQPDLRPPAIPPMRSMNIADRIIAIERDAAELSGPSRLVLDRFRRGRLGINRHAAFTDAKPNPREAKRSMRGRAAYNVSRDGHLLDEDIIEAEVSIVVREPQPGSSENRGGANPANASRPAGDNSVGAIDQKNYATYYGDIEEASVEIVVADNDLLGNAPTTDASGSAASAAMETVPENPKEPPCGSQEIGKIRRFFRALRGA